MFASSMLDPFLKLCASVLAFCYALTSNYALAIILLTLLVMLVVTPLTLKGTRSMMMMQQLQPEMRKIQARYKDDRQKLNEELLKFYKENNINPLGGCLPLLVQMPVFLVLYEVLRGLTRRMSDLGGAVGWMSGQFPANISKPPDLVRVFDPAWIQHSTKMYENLSQSTQMQAFGMDLSESASKALQQGVLHASPFLILIAIVAVTGFVQQRQIQGRNPNAQVNPQQQMIMKIMPIFLPVISFGLPAGLVLYFAVSNMYRIAQQAFISHSIYGGKANGMTWRDMLGIGPRVESGKPKASSSSKDRAKSKAIPASSKPTPKGKASARSAKATPKARATKGGRPAPSKTSSRSTKGDESGGAPNEASSGDAEPSTGGAKPSSGGAKPSSGGARRFSGGAKPSGSSGSGSPKPGAGANDSAPSLQPRARKKKR